MATTGTRRRTGSVRPTRGQVRAGAIDRPWTLLALHDADRRCPHQISAGLHGPLDRTHPTLAEFLAANGYATGGFVANTTYCGAETELSQGFAL